MIAVVREAAGSGHNLVQETLVTSAYGGELQQISVSIASPRSDLNPGPAKW